MLDVVADHSDPPPPPNNDFRAVTHMVEGGTSEQVTIAIKNTEQLPEFTQCRSSERREGKIDIMMVPVEDDEDDFIVQTVAEPSSPDPKKDKSTRGRKWGKYLGGLVFASKEPTPAAAEPEPEPTLPTGFSATLNAEEEKIYPAQVSSAASGSTLVRGARKERPIARLDPSAGF